MGHPGKFTIDSLQFARERGQRAGDVAVGHLRRLADVLADEEGSLAWKASGECDAAGKPFLALEVSGELHLKCQRCLGALVFQLSIKSHLRLVAPGAAWPDEGLEEDSYDPIEALEEQPLLPLIEDEVLLALPIAPRHGSCALPGYLQDGRELSPFAALGRLKKQ